MTYLIQMQLIIMSDPNCLVCSGLLIAKNNLILEAVHYAHVYLISRKMKQCEIGLLVHNEL